MLANQHVDFLEEKEAPRSGKPSLYKSVEEEKSFSYTPRGHLQSADIDYTFDFGGKGTGVRTECPTHSVESLAELNKIYRPNATRGSGSTAAAIREKISNGFPIKGKFHSRRGRDAIITLERWLKNHPQARAGDRTAAGNVIKDLRNVLD